MTMTTMTTMMATTMTTDAAPAPLPGRPWRVILVALAGLLVGVAVASVAAFILTRSVGEVADRARSDIALEDEAQDVLVGVLDLRHHQRTIQFAGPTRAALANFDDAYAELLQEIEELAEVAVEVPGLAGAPELRAQAEAYYTEYRGIVGSYATDRPAFDAASDRGLEALAVMEAEADALDDLGEVRSDGALDSVEAATSTAGLVILGVLVAVLAGAIALTVAALRMLRELRQLADTQLRAEERLREALRARTDFIADASHELRTPLTVLRGNAEVGLAMPSADCGHEPLLRDIVAESARMTRLVEDLLFLARSGAGSAPLEPRELDAEPWLAEVAARAEVLCQQRGVRLRTGLRAVGRVVIDPGRMEQAIMILIDNATKFSPPDGEVRLDAWFDGPALTIAVRDHGPGIAPDLVPYVFDRFRRGDRARDRQSGAGLGLSIAQAIIQGHEGTIAVDTTVASGARLVIRVPVTGARPPAAAVLAPASGTTR
jgi:signal transduction histidine kinase